MQLQKRRTKKAHTKLHEYNLIKLCTRQNTLLPGNTAYSELSGFKKYTYTGKNNKLLGKALQKKSNNKNL